VYTLEEDLRDQGIKLETRVLAYERHHEPPTFVVSRLRLQAGDRVGFLSLARLVDDRIICHDRRYFPSDIADRFDPASAQDGVGVSETLVQLTGMALGTIDWECDITPCSREVAEALRVTPGTLIAASAFTDCLESGRPIETGVISYRIDLCKFRFEARSGDVLMWRKAKPREA
jgi:DNA-binding GntR family transcriptional regulator